MDVIKSSRFWIALAIVISTTLLACLRIISGEVAMTMMAALLAGFGVAKAGNGLPRVLLPLAIIGALSSCTSWQATAKLSLDAAGSTASTARFIGEGYWTERCESVARRCAGEKRPLCPELVVCQDGRHAFILALIALQRARLDGYSLLISGAQVATKSALSRLAATIITITQMLPPAGGGMR